MKTINSFEDLEAFLRNWMSFADTQVYDAVGMFALFGACIDNIRKRILPVELDELSNSLSPEQKELLQAVVERFTET